MVRQDSYEISRASYYSGIRTILILLFHVQGFHLLWPAIPDCSIKTEFCNKTTFLQEDPLETHYTAITTLADYK